MVSARHVRHQHVEELETRHVLAHDDEAHRERRRQHETERSPQPRPEGDRDEQRHLRHACGAGVQHRFEDEVGEQLERDEKARDLERPRPSRQRCQREQNRTRRRRRQDPGTE